MANTRQYLKKSIAALKKLTEEEADLLATDAEIAGEPDKNEANEDAISEEDENELASNDEIMKKIEAATEELDNELDDQELSDELKESVRKFLKLKEEEIRDELEKEYSEKQEDFENELVDKADEYMNQIAEEWLRRNRVALKESIQTQRVQAFVRGFKKLLEENNIELPADAEAEIEKYKEECDDLKDELNKEIAESYKLRRALKSARKAVLVEKMISAKGLAMSRADKFRKLCEDVDFNGDEDKFNKEIAKEIKAVDEEEEGTTMDGKEVIDEPEELNNDDLKLSEAIAKIRRNRK